MSLRLKFLPSQEPVTSRLELLVNLVGFKLNLFCKISFAKILKTTEEQKHLSHDVVDNFQAENEVREETTLFFCWRSKWKEKAVKFQTSSLNHSEIFPSLEGETLLKKTAKTFGSTAES